MEAIELARRLAALGQTEEACKAYTFALESAAPEEKMEAAVYILQSGGDYRVSYTCFQELYGQGFFREDCLSIMTEAFYEPNVKTLKKRYEKNCRALEKYPYLFRKDFIPFDDLSIRFYPYDKKGYIPFFVNEERFGNYINFKNSVVSRNFFKELEKPILADDVFSQYELEYLNDNVRDSERVGRENHVYLHYTDWAVFCAYLQCLDMRALLEKSKFIFLIEDEKELYPIDFKERFGIDYSKFSPQPVGIREVNRIIWHTQLSAHNGGDFFNEVFDSHPNLLTMPSIYISDVEEPISEMRQALKRTKSLEEFQKAVRWSNPRVMADLYRIKHPTDKDLAVALFLGSSQAIYGMDQYARISPAIFFQPHFRNIQYNMEADANGQTVLFAEAADALHECRFFNEFKYIKTFTPIRRITTSYAATVRFMYQMAKYSETAEIPGTEGVKLIVNDVVSERVLNRSYLIDPEDRLYRDGVLVRFEDGKLNPRATFTALAAFFDLPYTESLTYCSEQGKRDPHPETKGFDPVTVYRTYDEFAGHAERYFLEYFMRDAYQCYGYDFHYYDGAPVDEEKAEQLIACFTTLNSYNRETWMKLTETARIDETGRTLTAEEREQVQEYLLNKYISNFDANRLKIAKLLLRGLYFVNKNGQPLHMMPMLELNPALLEQPLYR